MLQYVFGRGGRRTEALGIAATSFVVPSAEEMRSILWESSWDMLLSTDSSFGAMGRAAWAICSLVRRAARERCIAESLLPMESEAFISTESRGGRLWGIG